MVRPRRHHRGQRVAQIVDAVAGHGRHHEGLGKFQPLVGGLRQLQQLFLVDDIDLVDDQQLGMIDGRHLGKDRLGLLVDPLAGVEQHADEVGVMRPAPGGRHHGAVEPSLRHEDAGRIDQDDLGVVVDHDAADQRPGGLHLARDDGDLGADQRIDQRGLADIGGADQRDKAAACRRRRRNIALNIAFVRSGVQLSLLPPPTPSTPSRSIITDAATFSAARLLPPRPSAGSRPGRSTATRNWGS